MPVERDHRLAQPALVALPPGLPPALAPWSVWLALLPPELVAPLGDMLLRLQALVGRMAGVAPSPDAFPDGVGRLARRGEYRHLLLSQWALLDAAPDEFMRRAAGGELLFSAPEPQLQRRARICVALFDAGPAQLGEPRLVQIALFILLARRALDAGATFQWGTMQAPQLLRTGHGRDALRVLLAARTLARVGAPALAGWNASLARLGADADVWQVGAPGAAVVKRATAQACIEARLLDNFLDVTVTQAGGTRRLQLELPAPDVGARLLRHRFEEAAAPPAARRSHALSRMHAPHFAVRGSWIAATTVDGGSVLHAIANSARGQPGNPRRFHPPSGETELGVALFGRQLARVASNGTYLSFVRFPCKPFHDGHIVLHPPPDQFTAPLDLARALPAFFLIDHSPTGAGARVLMVDAARRLVCWTAFGLKEVSGMRFELLAGNVVGAAQAEKMLLYASSSAGRTTIHTLAAKATQASTIGEFAFASSHVLFCAGSLGHEYAMRTGSTQWQVVDRQPARPIPIEIPAGAWVIGVSQGGMAGAGRAPSLLVLGAGALTVELHACDWKRVILRSAVPIVQAVLDASGRRLCRLTSDQRLSVVDLYTGEVLLDVAAPAGEIA